MDVVGQLALLIPHLLQFGQGILRSKAQQAALFHPDAQVTVAGNMACADVAVGDQPVYQAPRQKAAECQAPDGRLGRPGRKGGQLLQQRCGPLEALLPFAQFAIDDIAAVAETQLLPLWAGIPANNRATALVEKTITNPQKFWRGFGLPAYLDGYTNSESSAGFAANENAQANYQAVNLQLNTMVGEGLVAYGYRPAAAELVSRLMEGVVEGLKRNGVMRRLINAHDGSTSGEANALSGLAPVGLFLEVLGVRILSPDRVELAGFNPFQYPVTVKYRGTTVLRQREKTVIIFPGGQTPNSRRSLKKRHRNNLLPSLRTIHMNLLKLIIISIRLYRS